MSLCAKQPIKMFFPWAVSGTELAARRKRSLERIGGSRSKRQSWRFLAPRWRVRGVSRFAHTTDGEGVGWYLGAERLIGQKILIDMKKSQSTLLERAPEVFPQLQRAESIMANLSEAGDGWQ